MALTDYHKKRKFNQTPEPKGKIQKNPILHFVVQKHDASRLHYDFRLEFGGVLHSWAVPKGPSLNPKDKRLAMEVEDHPVSYMKFEGQIPKGNYGAGDVIVWDFGVYANAESQDINKGLHEGRIKFVLYGEKLKGSFSLVKMNGKEKNAWLLIKEKDEYASDKDVTEEVNSVLSHNSLPRDKKRVKIAPMPHDIKPMLAKLVSEAFDRHGWIFEIKWDGYRAITEIENGKIKLYSRNFLDFKSSYPPIVEALELLAEHDCILDGEIVALKNSQPNFHALQQYKEQAVPLQYVIFDILYLDGEDLQHLPLIERKAKLRNLLEKVKGNDVLLFGDYIEEKGIAFFKKIQKAHIEGVIAKDGSSPYLAGVRSNSWLKIKTVEEQEAIIMGFTEPRKGRKYFGALVLGAYINGELRYIGHSGGGFTDKELADISRKLKKIKSDVPTLKEKIKINSPITWVKPEYVCQIKFTEWTSDGRMRHPIFTGLRVDKKPDEVIRETPEKALPKIKSIKRTTIIPKAIRTHPDKIFWPEEGYTKGDVLDYYDRMADIILPYQKDRPQNLLRHPNGMNDNGFFQKDITFQVPEFVELKRIWSESNNSYIRYLLCQNKDTLLYIANLGCIELNPWNSRIDHLDKPDYMIIDLDPSDKNSFDQVIQVAQEVHKILNLLCEEHYVKTSGKTGLHICIPTGAKYTYDELKPLSQIIVQLVNKQLPEITSIERNPAKRKNQIYLDYLQNRRGQTLASVYSLRPHPGATVSTPLEWKEVKKGLNPADFNIKTIEKRIQKKGDLWKSVLSHAIDLRDSLRCLEEHFSREKNHHSLPKRNKPTPLNSLL